MEKIQKRAKVLRLLTAWCVILFLSYGCSIPFSHLRAQFTHFCKPRPFSLANRRTVFLYVLSFINARPRKSTHPGPQAIAVIFCKGFYSHPQLCLLSALKKFNTFFFFLESVGGRGQGVHLMTHSEVSLGAVVHGTNLHFYKACLAQETEAA